MAREVWKFYWGYELNLERKKPDIAECFTRELVVLTWTRE